MQICKLPSQILNLSGSQFLINIPSDFAIHSPGTKPTLTYTTGIYSTNHIVQKMAALFINFTSYPHQMWGNLSLALGIRRNYLQIHWFKPTIICIS